MYTILTAVTAALTLASITRCYAKYGRQFNSVLCQGKTLFKIATVFLPIAAGYCLHKGPFQLNSTTVFIGSTIAILIGWGLLTRDLSLQIKNPKTGEDPALERSQLETARVVIGATTIIVAALLVFAYKRGHDITHAQTAGLLAAGAITGLLTNEIMYRVSRPKG